MSVVVTGFSGPTVASTTLLTQRVASNFGIDIATDDEFKQLVLDALDDATIDLNTNVWQFMKRRETSVALTASTNYVTIPSLFYKDSLAYLVRTSDSTQRDPLVYIPYDSWMRLVSSTITDTGEPYWYTLFNEAQEGKLYMHPAPDTSTATDYTLTIEYYQRIPMPSSTAQIDAPQELQNVILYGARKRVAMSVLGGAHPDVGMYAQLEQQALLKVKDIDHTHPDSMRRFRLMDRAFGGQRSTAGIFYIRIP